MYEKPKEKYNYPSVTLTRVFFGSWVGIFNFQMISELRFQISDLRFQISDSRFRICGGLGLASRPGAVYLLALCCAFAGPVLCICRPCAVYLQALCSAFAGPVHFQKSAEIAPRLGWPPKTHTKNIEFQIVFGTFSIGARKLIWWPRDLFQLVFSAATFLGQPRNVGMRKSLISVKFGFKT